MSALTNSLADIAARINAAHASVIGNIKLALEQAIELGELLEQAQAQVPHGGWLRWLEANTVLSERVAQNYMRLAKHKATLAANTNPNSYLTIDAALELLRSPKEVYPHWSIPPELKSLRQADRDARTGRILETSPDVGIKRETLKICTGVQLQQRDNERYNEFAGKELRKHRLRPTPQQAKRIQELEAKKAKLEERAAEREAEAKQLRQQAAVCTQEIRRLMRDAFLKDEADDCENN